MSCSCKVFPIREAGECLQQTLGVVLDIGSDVHPAMSGQLGSQQLEKGSPEQSSLVMTCLGPRIREENGYFLQTPLGEAPQHREDILRARSHICDAVRLHLQQQLPYSWAMNLHRQIVTVRISACVREQVFAVTGPDFQTQGRVPWPRRQNAGCIEIQGMFGQ